MKEWQVQEAKARFSDLIREAGDAPQEITHHGKPVAVVVSADAFEQITGPRKSLVEFIQQSPLYGDDEIDLEREDSLPRQVDL